MLLASTPLREARFAIVDLETTGASAVYDRVTEIAVVRVAGGRIVESYDSLVNPGVRIPPFITRLTGIDDRMVAGQPRLGELVPRIAQELDDAVFVAHNASFDWAFLKQGFARVGGRLEPERLCTVRLARRLVPGLRSYRLDALRERFGISTPGRHRARPDAEATAALLLELLELAERAGVRTVGALLRLQGQPIAGRAKRTVDEAVVGSLTDGPGVYLLKDAEGQVVYVGKSRHVRQRVRDHLRGDCPGQPRLRKHLKRVVDVEAIETGSELEALFLESKLIKRYLPEANVVGRGWRSYPFLSLDLQGAFPRVEMTREPADGATLFGPLRRASTVAELADFLSDTLGLRRCKDPIRPGMSACPLLELKKCLAPCVRPEAEAEYAAAIARLVGLLEGRDDRLLSDLVRRRDELAEALRFEQAAELRDRIRALEQLLGDQRRLEAVARRNVVVVAPSKAAACRELFFIRAGRLVDQRQVKVSARPDSLRRALRARFGEAVPDGPIDREVVDEMRQLETWLRRERQILTCVAVDPADPEASLAPLIGAMRAGRLALEPGASQPAVPTPLALAGRG